MNTDPEPDGTDLRREYDASNALDEVPLPPPAKLQALFQALAGAVKEEDAAKLERACTELLAELSGGSGIRPPTLELLGARPHSTAEGHLAAELFGDYHIKRERMRLWTRTAMKGKWTSSKTLLSTLGHEFMHHLDIVRLGFPHSFHTIGFFARTHRLYLTAIGHPYYPLAWRRLDRYPLGAGSWVIDWPATNRQKLKRLGRARPL